MKYVIYQTKRNGKKRDRLYMTLREKYSSDINYVYSKMSQFNEEDKDVEHEYEVRVIEE